jgi:hypothetical protein
MMFESDIAAFVLKFFDSVEERTSLPLSVRT